jgi:hypothetical protein
VAHWILTINLRLSRSEWVCHRQAGHHSTFRRFRARAFRRPSPIGIRIYRGCLGGYCCSSAHPGCAGDHFCGSHGDVCGDSPHLRRGGGRDDVDGSETHISGVGLTIRLTDAQRVINLTLLTVVAVSEVGTSLFESAAPPFFSRILEDISKDAL